MKALNVDAFVVSGVASMVVVFYYVILNGRMMAYIEKHIFGDPKSRAESRNEKKWYLS